MLDPAYLAGVQPELDVVNIGKLFRLFHGLGIVGALHWNAVEKVPV